MSWIESHQALERHPKTLKLTTEMGWSVDTTIGKLHRFWWWCVDYAEDGGLSKYNDQIIGGSVGLDGDEAKKFVDAMITAAWIDRTPYLRVHDWWTYIGRFLQVKYKHYPEKWMEIKALYNNRTKNRSKGSSKGSSKNQLPTIPNQPTIPIYLTDDKFDVLWNKHPRKLGKEKAREFLKKQILNDEDFSNCEKAVDNYAVSVQGKEIKFIQHGSTFFNKNWKDWIDYKETPLKIVKPEVKYGFN